MSKRHEFEADLNPGTGQPRIRMNFDNGWSISLVMRMPGNRTTAQLCSVAICPSGRWGTGKTQLLGEESSADEVAAHIATTAALPRYTRSAVQ